MHLGILKITYNRTAQPRCYHSAFYGQPFRELRRGEASESVTVCFVISLSIYCSNADYCMSRVCVRMCVRKREGERGSQRSVCVCVCVMCSRVWERETWSHNRSLCENTYELHHCVCHETLGLELMVKLRTLLTVFIFILKAKACDYGEGRYISNECLWCSANHNDLGQLANQSRLCLSEGGTL